MGRGPCTEGHICGILVCLLKAKPALDAKAAGITETSFSKRKGGDDAIKLSVQKLISDWEQKAKLVTEVISLTVEQTGNKKLFEELCVLYFPQ